jgi:hypothetical protein
MYDGEAVIIIGALSLAIGIFVGAISPAIYGWSTKAAGWR